MKSILIICVVLIANLCCMRVSVQAQEVIADTRADFSLVAQGTNGFQYGYYTADNVKGTFITTGMTVVGSDWNGTGSHGTPVTGETFMHPAATQPAVRRYAVGTNGEPAIDGFVVIEGKFWDAQTGNSNNSIGFVTIWIELKRSSKNIMGRLGMTHPLDNVIPRLRLFCKVRNAPCGIPAIAHPDRTTQ